MNRMSFRRPKMRLLSSESAKPHQCGSNAGSSVICFEIAVQPCADSKSSLVFFET